MLDGLRNHGPLQFREKVVHMCKHSIAGLVVGWLLLIGIAPARGARPLTADEAELVSKLQSEPDPADRLAAARTLGWKRDDRFVEVLAGALNDTATSVRLAAVQGLGDIGTNE